MSLCDYGCGQVATFLIGNNKHCCNKSPNRCPAIKEKNSRGVSNAHKEGRAWSFKDEHRDKSVELRRDSSAKKTFVEYSTATNETV